MASRNPSIDILKLGLSFLIVALHIFPVSGLKGVSGILSYEIVNGITRIGVPTFFIISGYFLRNKINDKAYLMKYGKRILFLFIVWQLIYLPDLIRFYNLGRFSTFDLILKLVYGYWHLWYLMATVGGVLLLYCLRMKSVQQKIIVALFLFFLGYAFQLAYKTNLLNDFPALKLTYEVMGTSRNFIFMAYPFLVLGTLYEYWKNTVYKIRFLFVPFLLLLFLESYLYYTLKIGALDFLITILPLSSLLFSLAVENKMASVLQIPSTLSLGVYLCHPYAVRLVYEFLPQKTFGYVSLKYVLICLLAIAFWFIVERINRKFSYFL
ncbi:acyltransferase [Flavobacterium limnosediminis JC2902]|uniref:Acyltransferase n=1 Tax=Flavobacterium limnosediminis JC2902 TaxID=1341181 RepID=V6SK88_9FLAO|nr:acyltransferase family protein [Flavobacterium limnosediminis]ESU27016.1 acyltransferase [Flavobacterium limnosediminis JC2902]